jgi:hypothetical protein
MCSGPFYSALAGEVILHDSNTEFQCVIGLAHKLHLTQLVSTFGVQFI